MATMFELKQTIHNQNKLFEHLNEKLSDKEVIIHQLTERIEVVERLLAEKTIETDDPPGYESNIRVDYVEKGTVGDMDGDQHSKKMSDDIADVFIYGSFTAFV